MGPIEMSTGGQVRRSRIRGRCSSTKCHRNPIQVAVDVALLDRYYERFADQAVSVARRLDYVVAGTMPAEPRH